MEASELEVVVLAIDVAGSANWTNLLWKSDSKVVV